MKIDYFEQMIVNSDSSLGNKMDQFDIHTLRSLKQSQIIYESVKPE